MLVPTVPLFSGVVTMEKRKRQPPVALSHRGSQLEGHEGTGGPTDTLLQRYPSQRKPRVLPACSFFLSVSVPEHQQPIYTLPRSQFFPSIFPSFPSSFILFRFASKPRRFLLWRSVLPRCPLSSFTPARALPPSREADVPRVCPRSPPSPRFRPSGRFVQAVVLPRANGAGLVLLPRACPLLAVSRSVKTDNCVVVRRFED